MRARRASWGAARRGPRAGCRRRPRGTRGSRSRAFRDYLEFARSDGARQSDGRDERVRAVAARRVPGRPEPSRARPDRPTSPSSRPSAPSRTSRTRPRNGFQRPERAERIGGVRMARAIEMNLLADERAQRRLRRCRNRPPNRLGKCPHRRAGIDLAGLRERRRAAAFRPSVSMANSYQCTRTRDEIGWWTAQREPFR